MSGTGGRNGSGTQACAVCKYRRRKCTPDCILAPYFPPEKQRQFLNAHKLFGVANILNIIRDLNNEQKGEAMRSIIFEADMRAIDPVGGCFRIVLDLQREVERTKAELNIVLHQLALCREQQQQQQQMPAAAAATAVDVHHTQLGLNVNSDVVGMNDYNSMQQNQFLYRQDLAPWMDVQQHNNNMIMENGCMDSSSTQILDGECEEMRPLVETFDRKPAFVDANESFPCSSRVGLEEENDSLEQVQEHDLKGAASFFTLKNSNTSSV